ncbi:MAG: radical SAM protein [Pseudomonadales bacterium]
MNMLNNARSLKKTQELGFLWLELTNRCNLECIHCYADSSPRAVDENPLSLEEYTKIIAEARSHGCWGIQFIGGEPTLNRYLPTLIQQAHKLGYDVIEVFTNLVSLPAKMIDVFAKYDVKVATSIYSNSAATHDAVTGQTGSWEKTVTNLKKLLDRDLTMRASVIGTSVNKNEFDATKTWLNEIGLKDVGFDEARDFGRGQKKQSCELGDLCGQCSKDTLCIDPNGKVSPCIMSKAWPVGDIRESGIGEMLVSDQLREVRGDIFDHTLKHQAETMGGCNPSSKNPCGPDSGDNCNPCSPNGHCGPNDCQPKRS